MNKTVKVVQVERIKSGKADRIILHYEGTDGSAWKIGALAAKLDAGSRKALDDAKAGDMLPISLEKVGNYWNLIRAGEHPTAQEKIKDYPKAAFNQAPVKSKETDTRIQVMNALTNAVASLGEGKTVDAYRARVIELVLMGNDVVSLAMSGGLDALKAPAFDMSDDDETLDELPF